MRGARHLRHLGLAAGVFGVALLALLLADAVPGWVAERRGEIAHDYETPTELENALGVRLGLPFYFPDFLAWPPSVLRARRSPLQTYVEVTRRDAPKDRPRAPAMVIRQWTGGAPHFHEAIAMREDERGALPVRAGPPATFSKGHAPDGRELLRARAVRGDFTTELTASAADLGWTDFTRMVESLGP